jgi:predicted enzyme related to lactoylglutathione lyase
MPHNPVGWFEIYVQDIARARAFYEAVLGITLERLPGTGLEMWAFPMLPETAGAPGALVQYDGMPAGGNSTVVYFVCADCAVEAGRAVAAGGSVFKDKSAIGPYGFIALVNDSEGNLIGLHSMQ